MSGFAGHTNRPSTGSANSPQWKWWVPGAGINRSVITSEIQQYLGQDALVKPGKGSGENQGIDGYWIAAYRNLTSAMLQDLKDQSARYEKQKEAPARFQDPHHDPRNPALRPTPPLTHGTSAYPPPTTMSPYGQEQGFAPPRQGQPMVYDNPSYVGQPDTRDGRDPREMRDPRDPFYQQGGQAPYPQHGQSSGVSPHTPQYVHPHFPAGAPVSQGDAAAYGYTSPPSQYPPGAYVPGPNNGPRRDQFAVGYSGPPQPTYGYQTSSSDSPAPNAPYAYPQGNHHSYR